MFGDWVAEPIYPQMRAPARVPPGPAIQQDNKFLPEHLVRDITPGSQPDLWLQLHRVPATVQQGKTAES